MRAPVIAAAILASTTSAHADQDGRSVTLVIPGYLFSATTGQVAAVGHGAELTVLHVTDSQAWTGVGLVGQLQSYSGGHARAAVAAELTWAIFGCELGWAVRRSDGVHPTQHGVHFAPYVSLGIVSLAWRTTAPLGGGEGRYGWESGVALTLKAPLPVHNWKNVGMYTGAAGAGGRALRDDDGAILLPDVIEGRTRGALPPDRARWIDDARLEHASIESFLWLADDLDAHGAPTELVARAAEAAEEERRHASLCLGFAGPGLSVRSRTHPRRRRPRPDVVRLARDAWFDGVLGEGSAARSLAIEASRTDDPLRAQRLIAIAEEEAGHARLSADILRWLGQRAQ